MQIIVNKPIVMRCPSGTWVLSLLALPCHLCTSNSFVMLQAQGRPTRLQCQCGWTAKLGRIGTWLLEHTRAGIVPLGTVRQIGKNNLEIGEGRALLDLPEPACSFQQE